jgi:hypothetical protein
MHMLYDEDEYEVVHHYRACTACNGDLRRCNGRCNGSAGYSLRRREPSEIAEIKAKRQREHEDALLVEADAIRARRSI